MKTMIKIALLTPLLALQAFAGNFGSIDQPGQVQNDQALVQAVRARRNVFYVQGANLTVRKVLPDDTSGLPHQKWIAQLTDGSTIQVVYNSDMGNRVPMKEGDTFGVGGQFLWLRTQGLIHWLHEDPRHNRPDGYIYFNGVVYGETNSGYNRR